MSNKLHYSTWGMASISPNKTGLDHIVWVRTSLPCEKEVGEPCLYVHNAGEFVSVPIAKDAGTAVGKALAQWIRLNRESLLQLWHGYVTADIFIERIKRL